MAQTRYKDCLFVCPLVPIRHKEEETREDAAREGRTIWRKFNIKRENVMIINIPSFPYTKFQGNHFVH